MCHPTMILSLTVLDLCKKHSLSHVISHTKLTCVRFMIIWKQCFIAVKCVQMDNYIKKKLHKCQ